MLLTCPLCHNFLRISPTPSEAVDPGSAAAAAGKHRFECRVCPYQLPLPAHARLSERSAITPKEADDVMGGADKWKNADRTEAKCPADRCDNAVAFFYQVQIRSADEPMTSFYRCTKCGKRWKE